jgi:AcrR family transcriptional regulator
MEREGYAALTIRSLADELGTSHSTLYNYVGHVEDIESQALHKLTEQLPMPSAFTPRELRGQLKPYLLAAFRLLLQHPHVLFPPAGSASWKTLYDIGEKWVAALTPYAANEKAARIVLNALLSTTAIQAERERAYGPDYASRARKVIAAPKARMSPEEVLEATIDALLPNLASGRKAAQ